MAEDTWYSLALPILEYLNKVEPLSVVNIGELADAIGADPQAVVREVDRLHSAGYIARGVHKMLTGRDVRPWFMENPELGERGARAIGVWPSEDPYDALVALLERELATAEDGERKSKIRALLSTVTEVGKTVGTEILVEWAKRGVFH